MTIMNWSRDIYSSNQFSETNSSSILRFGDLNAKRFSTRS
jgi:hypothetical protein